MKIKKYIVIEYSEKYKLPVGTIIVDDVETSILTYPTGEVDYTGSYPFRNKHKELDLFRQID